MVSTAYERRERVRSGLQALDSDTTVRIISSMGTEPIRFELAPCGRVGAPAEPEATFARSFLVATVVVLLGAVIGMLTQESELAIAGRVAGIVASSVTIFVSLTLAFVPSVFEALFVGRTPTGGRPTPGAARVT